MMHHVWRMDDMALHFYSQFKCRAKNRFTAHIDMQLKSYSKFGHSPSIVLSFTNNYVFSQAAVLPGKRFSERHHGGLFLLKNLSNRPAPMPAVDFIELGMFFVRTVCRLSSA